jgi:hypothetical protein
MTARGDFRSTISEPWPDVHDNSPVLSAQSTVQLAGDGDAARRRDEDRFCVVEMSDALVADAARGLVSKKSFLGLNRAVVALPPLQFGTRRRRVAFSAE